MMTLFFHSTPARDTLIRLAPCMEANAEANVAIYDRAFAGQVKSVIEADIARSDQIMLEQWKHRSLWERIREYYFGLYKDVF